MNDFDKLVELVTEKVIERLKIVEQPAVEQPHVYILGQPTEALIQQLTAQNYHIVSQRELATSLCLAELSLGRLGRIATMVPSDLEEEQLVSHLLSKKEVLVDFSARGYLAELNHYPYGMKKRIMAFEADWQRYGAIFMRKQPATRKRVLSLNQVQQSVRAGETNITLSKETLITPLAKDYLKENQITLINE